MRIIEHYLDVGKESRPGKKLHEVKAVVMHWTAVPKQTWQTIVKWWDNDENFIFGSGHEINDIFGDVILTIPFDEVAYGAGSNHYTDFAVEFFGDKYCSNKPLTPNYLTYHIEMIPIDLEGNFTQQTYDTAVKRAAHNLDAFKLSVDTGLLMHSHIRPISEKVCPKKWASDPAAWELFKLDVKKELG